MIRALLPLLAVAGLATDAIAQTVRTVPGQFPTIAAAILASSPGDVIEVGAGTYDPFVLDKALTIVAAAGAAPVIRQQTYQGSTTTVFRPANGTAHVQGLHFRNPIPFGFATRVSVLSGAVAFADCLFEGHSNDGQGALLVDGSAVVLQRCLLLGSGADDDNSVGPGVGGAGGNGLWVHRGWVAATDCVFLGGKLNWDFCCSGGHGVAAESSTVHLVRCALRGGEGPAVTCASYPGGDGLRVTTGYGTWLADCHLVGGNGLCGVGGDGLRNLGGVPVELARTTAVGGNGATPGNAYSGAQAPADLLGFAQATTPPVLGSTWQARYQTVAGTTVAIVAALDLAPRQTPLAPQRTWLPADHTVLAIGIAGPAGTVPFAIALPADPVLRHAAVWVHAFAGVALPLQAAPPIGGPLQ